MRNISLTADLSKNYEYILAEWLKPYIMKRIDPGQCGGLHGHSTTHYLIMLYNFILSNTDNSYIPRSVLVALTDFSKAFNRINHFKVMVRLSDWRVPTAITETEARLKFVDNLSIAECTSSNVSNQETLQKF